MQCSKGTCPSTSNDPKISVMVIDQEKGSTWGFYCNYDCAVKDVGASLLHMAEGGEIATMPDPAVEESAAPVEAPGNGSYNPSMELDETWHPNQLYVNQIAVGFSKAIPCVLQTAGIYTIDGKTAEALFLTVGATVKLVGNNVLIDVQSDDYNILLTPETFSVDDAVPQFTEHIKQAVKALKDNANSAPF